MTGCHHPKANELELLYLGAGSSAVSQHAEGCASCREALRALAQERAALLVRAPATGYVRRLRAEHDSSRERARARGLWGALALAAAVGGWLLLAQGSKPASSQSPLALNDAANSLSEHAALAVNLQAERLVSKGDSSLRIVRRRGEEQSIEEGPVTVVPGDTLRLRFVLKEAGTVVAGIVADKGEWVPLLEADFSAGPHMPDTVVSVTREPGGGLLLLGSPKDVAAARAGKPADVQRVRLVWREHPAQEYERPAAADALSKVPSSRP